jgi:hypothetical protein
MHTVRTTMRPDVEVEVDDADYLDLKRQGLLVETETQPDPTPGPAAPKKAAPSATTSKEG